MHPVSVVIPAYNSEAIVERSIRSALANDPTEVIVVDDGSRDGTADVARRIAGVRVIQTGNRGQSAARNTGIATAKCPWIGLLDHDDEWLPGKLDAQMAEARAGVGVIATLSDRACEKRLQPPRIITTADLWQANWFAASSVLLRREMWEQTGGFNEIRVLQGAEDYNLWLRISQNCEIVCVQRVLLHYAWGGASANQRKQFYAYLANLDDLAARGWDKGVLRKKRIRTFDEGARMALWYRDGELAREAARSAFSLAPSPRRAAILAAAYAPSRVLDVAGSFRRMIHV